MLCRKLLNTLSQEFATAYIHNPYLDPTSLLLAIADELGMDCSPTLDRHTLLKRITGYLMECDVSGRGVVLCLDEVQAMPVETLETLRLLTNLETEKRKLLQVVLFGQPELDKLLSEPSIRQLKQRITFSYELVPLNRLGLLSYVRHRLSIVQQGRRMLFSKGALSLLYSASNGIPRLINILCHKALMVAYGRGDVEVGRMHMQVAVHDTLQAQQLEKPRSPGWLAYLGWTGCACIATTALAVVGLRLAELLGVGL